jgi:hypothetical protein
VVLQINSYPVRRPAPARARAGLQRAGERPHMPMETGALFGLVVVGAESRRARPPPVASSTAPAPAPVVVVPAPAICQLVRASRRRAGPARAWRRSGSHRSPSAAIPGRVQRRDSNHIIVRVVYVYAIKKVASYVCAMEKFSSTCMPRTRSSLTYMPFWMDSVRT